ncbi:putative molybdenum cofactor guanylyltransferase [Caloramator mitchellensis]|uniref:Probable molybdenum cofactor guanylyltransferase n=1 Tax=Caloramator mitchellensis TaxID=908809 RepID=A0A0R3JUB0_CALMK|nr:molybdenum cofactor guanylyltransferase [Caloramator mitchellensis]KRQ87136.1 putative molybdenum cofactor guanylyltransferase [Caloramator mitchellensis]
MELFNSAAILCGGKSSRMRYDKSRLIIDGKFIIDLIKDELLKEFADVIYIVNDLKRFDYEKIFVDVYLGCGPAGAIYTALLKSTSKYVFVTACDMPFVNIDYINYMKNILINKKCDCLITKKGEWIEPLFAFYSKDMIEIFKKNIERENYKLFDVIKESNYYAIEEKEAKKFSADLDMFFNLNYQKDLEVLFKRFRRVEYYRDNKKL